jgi:transcriptional regulator with XRE-family HTH domain
MNELYKYIGNKIRELRQSYGVKGISQDDLAKNIKTSANTISRWETATYKPSAIELHSLAKFFGVNISVFFPEMENPRLQALMSALGNLDESDLDELTQYAQYRKAKQLLDAASKEKKKRG